MMNMMKLTSGRGPDFQKTRFFSLWNGAKGEFEFITLHDVHKLKNTLRFHLNTSDFMNIMKMYEAGIFNGFFLKCISTGGRGQAQFYELEKTIFIMFIKFWPVRKPGLMEAMMEPRILFAKHWWRVCFRHWQVAAGQRARKAWRVKMRETAKTVFMWQKGGCDGK